jgi:Zn-dependent peptidase ImmA (M78 family)
MKVQKLARRYWVSGYVTLRRARELGTVTEHEYFDIKARETNRRKKDKGGGGNYYKHIETRMSPTFTSAVLSDVSTGKIDFRDAAGLLGMKVPTVAKFVERWK